ncbi:hypothetical protein B0H11DRAFT_2253212 [Mycena galericulata]|nr:hypothetical protein B0H11DRAFT_2253212 [Mycena galericulata]
MKNSYPPPPGGFLDAELCTPHEILDVREACETRNRLQSIPLPLPLPADAHLRSTPSTPATPSHVSHMRLVCPRYRSPSGLWTGPCHPPIHAAPRIYTLDALPAPAGQGARVYIPTATRMVFPGSALRSSRIDTRDRASPQMHKIPAPENTLLHPLPRLQIDATRCDAMRGIGIDRDRDDAPLDTDSVRRGDPRHINGQPAQLRAPTPTPS